MKPDKFEEAMRWLAEAGHDLGIVRLALREGYFAHSCFMSHQTVEKALKALAYLRGDRFVTGHSISTLVASLIRDYPDLEPIRIGASKLDLYYLPTRYPDALPGGLPHERFDSTDAQQAEEVAAEMIGVAQRLVASR